MKGANIACRTRFCRGLSSDSGRRDDCHLGRPHHQEARKEDWLKRGFGIARAPSPGVRGVHPWTPLSPCRLRSRPPGCACRQDRLSGHGRPLAKSVRVGASCHRAGEAGIGERLRSDEVLRGTTKLLPAPPTNHPRARGPLGWLKRCFWIASAASSTTHSGYSPGTER
jgi:hypothetical protein